MNEAERPQEIRKKIREARRNAGDDNRTSWNVQICQRVSELAAFETAQRVAGFLAFDGEADPLALMEAAVDGGKEVYVPIIVAKAQPLMFAPWRPDSPMKKNRFGILEPDVPSSQWLQARELDCVITPLVAFDDSCRRIGVGGGFYDRSFAFLNDSCEKATSHLVGFAYSLQQIASIDSQPWDVVLNEVVTEANHFVREV